MVPPSRTTLYSMPNGNAPSCCQPPDTHYRAEGIEQLTVKHVQAGSRVAVTHGRNGFRFAEKMEAHVDVVDQEIENAAAAFGGSFSHPPHAGAAQRRRKKALAHRAESGHGIAQRHIFGEEAQHLRAHEDFAGAVPPRRSCAARPRHPVPWAFPPVRACRRAAPATATSSCRKVGRQRSTASMSGSPRTRCQVAVLLDRGEIEAFARASQIALCGRQVARELPLIVGKDRRQGRARHLARGAQVNAAHET